MGNKTKTLVGIAAALLGANATASAQESVPTQERHENVRTTGHRQQRPTHEVRVGDFSRVMSRTEFRERYAAELQEARKEAVAGGKDVTELEPTFKRLEELNARGEAIPKLDIEGRVGLLPKRR